MSALDNDLSRTERVARLHEPHMRALEIYVEALRVRYGDVPSFDPCDGGTAARMLMLLETPGPSAELIRFVSQDNPTATARNLRAFFAAAGIERRVIALWNAVPWILPRRDGKLAAPRRSDLTRAAPEVAPLLALFPALEVVVLAGRAARSLRDRVARPGIALFEIAHPSPVYVNTAPHIRNDVVATLTEARRSLSA